MTATTPNDQAQRANDLADRLRRMGGGQFREAPPPPPPAAPGGKWDWPWVTLGVIVLWIAIYWAGKTNTAIGDALFAAGRLNNEKVMAGEWHRLVVAGFLHTELIDMIFNVWFFFTAGKMMERLLGRFGMLAVFLLAGLGGGIAVVAKGHERYILSTATTYGVIGGLMGIYFRYHREIPRAMRGSFFGFLPLVVIFGILMLAGYYTVDPAEFLGGLLTGVAAPFVLPRMGLLRPLHPSDPGYKRPVVVPTLVIAALLLSLVGLFRAGTKPNVFHAEGWSVQVPAGFVPADAGQGSVEFRAQNRQTILAVERERKLVRADLDELRTFLRQRYGLRAGRKELGLETLTLGNGESFLWMRATLPKDDSIVWEYYGGEASTRLMGIFFAAQAPKEETERAASDLRRMAESFAYDAGGGDDR